MASSPPRSGLVQSITVHGTYNDGYITHSTPSQAARQGPVACPAPLASSLYIQHARDPSPDRPSAPPKPLSPQIALPWPSVVCGSPSSVRDLGNLATQVGLSSHRVSNGDPAASPRLVPRPLAGLRCLPGPPGALGRLLPHGAFVSWNRRSVSPACCHGGALGRP
jgi:hypothetical protein